MQFVPFEVRYPPEWIYDPEGVEKTIVLDKHAPMHRTCKDRGGSLPGLHIHARFDFSVGQGMEELVHVKLSRFIGVSNFNVQLLLGTTVYITIPSYFYHSIYLHPHSPAM